MIELNRIYSADSVPENQHSFQVKRNRPSSSDWTKLCAEFRLGLDVVCYGSLKFVNDDSEGGTSDPKVKKMKYLKIYIAPNIAALNHQQLAISHFAKFVIQMFA